DRSRLLPLLLGRRLRSFSELHVGAEATVHHVDVLAGLRIDAKRAWTFRLRAHELERFLDGEIGRRNVVRQRSCAPRATLSNLDERTEASNADPDQLAAIGIGSQIEHRVIRPRRAMLDS